MEQVITRTSGQVTGLQIPRVFPAVVRVERMPRGCVDVLAVDGEVHNLVVVMHKRVDDGVFFDLPGQFIVDPMVSVL
ncbi:MAG: hypothetical protein AAFU54_29000 [Chloroflexota bacterium]